MSVRGVPQLRSLVVKYCDRAGSSRGVLEYVRSNAFTEFCARVNDDSKCQVEAIVERTRTAHVIATYVSGKSKAIGLKNASASAASETCERLKNEKGLGNSRKPMKTRKFTSSPSVQGRWTPFTFGEGAPYESASASASASANASGVGSRRERRSASAFDRRRS